MNSISAQKTISKEFENGELVNYEDGKLASIEPDYTKNIPLGQLRRMGKVSRMGIGASKPLIDNNKEIDGIIVGTGNGGLEDCIKFLDQIVRYEEGVLTPTNFVQSTPNGLAGQLALGSNNHHYNSTHVNGSLAFENALVDAQLFFDKNKGSSKQLILCAVDEISTYNYNIDRLNESFKKEQLSSLELINSQSDGTLRGEGATSFIVSNDPTNSIAEIVDVAQITYPEEDELLDVLTDFLTQNKLENSDIDFLLLGKNGDQRIVNWYDLVEGQFHGVPSESFKHYCGEYKTAIGFGIYFSTLILNQRFSLISEKPKTILIYNQYEGVRHSFVLMKGLLN